MLRTFVLSVLASLFASIASAGELSGRASYRERIALPPEATFRAILYDISNNDQVEIGRFEGPVDAGPPYLFTIEYADADVLEGGLYAIKTEVIWPDLAYVAAEMVLEGYPPTSPEIDLLMVRPGIAPAAGVDSSNAASEEDDMIGAHGLVLPANFEVMVKVDGREEHWRLALFSDQTFQLSRIFSSDGAETGRRDSLGRWDADTTADTIVLRDGAEMPLVVRRMGNGDLAVIDGTSDAPRDGTLSRSEPTPLELEGMTLAGMMTYMADAAVFEECVSGVTFPVAMEGDYLALESAYLTDRPAPGEPLYVMFDGGLAMREDMEGPARQMVLVDRFLRTRPGITCERQKADASLLNTYWRLDELDGAPFPQGAGRQEPHLVLETGDNAAYRATLGCNRLRGGYSLAGDDLGFAPSASTMMACPAPLDALEQAFSSVLADVAGFAIEGETLVLQDANGNPRAIFTAVYF